MGRKVKFGDEVRAYAVGLRKQGMTLGDIRDCIKRKFGEAPEIMWISRVVNAQAHGVLTECSRGAHENGEQTPVNDSEKTSGFCGVTENAHGALTEVERAVAEVEAQVEAAASGAELDVEVLRRQLKHLEALRVKLGDAPAAVASLARAILQTLAEIRRREPPPPPPKELPPDWLTIEASAREKMHTLLDRLLEENGQPAQTVPAKG